MHSTTERLGGVGGEYLAMTVLGKRKGAGTQSIQESIDPDPQTSPSFSSKKTKPDPTRAPQAGAGVLETGRIEEIGGPRE